MKQSNYSQVPGEGSKMAMLLSFLFSWKMADLSSHLKKLTLTAGIISLSIIGFSQNCARITSASITQTSPNNYRLTVNWNADGQKWIRVTIYCNNTVLREECISINCSANCSGTSTFDYSCTGTTRAELVGNTGTCTNGTDCGPVTIVIPEPDPDPADFSPSHDIDGLSFTPGQTKDLVVNINEVLNGESTGQLQFRVRKTSAFTITYNPTATTANFAGGTPVDNNDWIFSEDANFITVTLKPGEVIGPYETSSVGFTVTRNQGVPINTTQNITTTIVTGTGGDTNSANNQAVTSITAN